MPRDDSYDGPARFFDRTFSIQVTNVFEQIIVNTLSDSVDANGIQSAGAKSTSPLSFSCLHSSVDLVSPIWSARFLRRLTSSIFSTGECGQKNKQQCTSLDC